MKRRDKILRAYLPAVNPLVDFALTDTALTFTNAAVAAHVADECAGYEATWARFDNATGEVTAIGAPTTGSAGRVGVPADLPSTQGSFVKIQVRAIRPVISAWSVPIDVYFKRTTAGGRWWAWTVFRPRLRARNRNSPGAGHTASGTRHRRRPRITSDRTFRPHLPSAPFSAAAVRTLCRIT